MENDVRNLDNWMKLLDPEEVKFQLITSAFYITSYDILIESIVHKLKGIYLLGFDDNEMVLDEKYKTEVKNLYKKDIVIASAIWHRNKGAISDEDVERIKLFKEHKNELAHELSEIIGDSTKRTKTELIKEIRELRFKILKWWFINFEMKINPQLFKLKPEDLDFNEVLGLNMFVINHLVNILDDEISKREKKP